MRKYVDLKKKNKQQHIWLCTINGHGKFLAVTLIDYGSSEINAFTVNVGVSSSIFNKGIIKLTYKVLAEVEIEPNIYLQDAENLVDESVVAIQSCSMLIFTGLKAFDVLNQDFTVQYSSAIAFKKALGDVTELSALIKFNKMAKSPPGRLLNLKLNKDIFSTELIDKLLEKIATRCPTIEKFTEIAKYLSTVFNAFRVLWEREELIEESELEENSRKFIQVILFFNFLFENNSQKSIFF